MECQALRRSRLGAVELLPVLGRGVHEILHTGRRRVGVRGARVLPAPHAAETDASYVCASMNAYVVTWVTSRSRRTPLPCKTRWLSVESRSPPRQLPILALALLQPLPLIGGDSRPHGGITFWLADP